MNMKQNISVFLLSITLFRCCWITKDSVAARSFRSLSFLRSFSLFIQTTDESIDFLQDTVDMKVVDLPHSPEEGSASTQTDPSTDSEVETDDDEGVRALFQYCTTQRLYPSMHHFC